MFQEKNTRYPFIIANTDVSSKEHEHWWNILDIEPKKEFFFLFFFFILFTTKKTVQKILSGIEKMTRADNKITLVKVKFSVKACKNLSQKEIVNLSNTARDFFHFVQTFGYFLKVKDYLDIWMIEDPTHMTETVTCGLF